MKTETKRTRTSQFTLRELYDLHTRLFNKNVSATGAYLPPTKQMDLISSAIAKRQQAGLGLDVLPTGAE